MPRAKLKVKFEIDRKELAAFKRLWSSRIPSRVNKEIRAALSRVAVESRRFYKRESPKDTGTLRTSLWGKSKYRVKKGGFVIAGVRSHFTRYQVVKKDFLGQWLRVEKRVPMKYEHLIFRTGARPHLIPIKRGPFAGLVVRHPGMSVHPARKITEAYMQTLAPKAIEWRLRVAAHLMRDENGSP